MTIVKKIKWFLALSIIFFVILATNQIDKRNFIKVEQSVEKIYNERLLAKELLLKISIKFHQKELAFALNNSDYLKSKNDNVNKELTELMMKFDRVEATKNEKLILDELIDNHKKLMQFETNKIANAPFYTADCAQIFTAINSNIADLSAEQISEGKNQKFFARSAADRMKLFSKIEVYILIVLAVLMLFIIFYSPKKSSD